MPITRNGGYLPLEDYGLIGDGSTAALVGRDGALEWLCVPRFDSRPLFCRLLDSDRGGSFTITLDHVLEARQFYEEDTAVLATELRGRTGMIRIIDCFPLRSGSDLREDSPATRREVLRQVKVLQGQVRLRVECVPWGGADAEPNGEQLEISCRSLPGLKLALESTRPLTGLDTWFELTAGEEVSFQLRWSGHRQHPFREPSELLNQTRDIWRKWMGNVRYEGPQPAMVRRSAITLKLLDYFENGALVASPTSSLPERIGGSRNWDYRYAWIRDAAFAVYALNRIGLAQEAAGFLSWVLNAAEHDQHPRVLYDLDGNPPPPERVEPSLNGYRGSHPVRWGNAAADQRQHDVYGEIVDCAHQWSAHHGRIDKKLWARLHTWAEAARREWMQPDQGIWEVRTSGRPFTYSAALCHTALDRAARLAERFDLAGDASGWRKSAEEIRQAILEDAWDPDRQALTEHMGGGGLDASLLALPLRRVLPADHPRMIATVEAIVRHLGAGDGLLYRYLPEESPDGLSGHEGAFLLCSFWLVDNLAKQGKIDEAGRLYESLCGRAGPLGLLPEQIDPSTGAFLGNYPQGFSHIGVISSGVNLARLMRDRSESQKKS